MKPHLCYILELISQFGPTEKLWFWFLEWNLLFDYGLDLISAQRWFKFITIIMLKFNGENLYAFIIIGPTEGYNNSYFLMENLWLFFHTLALMFKGEKLIYIFANGPTEVYIYIPFSQWKAYIFYFSN